jgi:2-polyprenyl-3-methyl-5-hydroxy-6-metoxy-1,4-benzoquinol methylase
VKHKKYYQIQESYSFKEEGYFNATRWTLIKFVEGSNNRILEVGCGSGNTGQALKKEGKAKEVIGVEIESEIAKEAGNKLDQVISGDIEVIDLPFEKEFFDYIIVADVLEHLRDPWETLINLKYYLKERGYVIASIPNIRNWRILRDLIFRGKWEYTKAGILDNTHLRFFTKKSIIELFKKNGYGELKIIPAFKVEVKKSKTYLINILTFGLLKEFLTAQYIIKAKK